MDVIIIWISCADIDLIMWCITAFGVLYLGEAEVIHNFLMHFPTYPNSFLVGGPADYFVIELTDMVHMRNPNISNKYSEFI